MKSSRYQLQINVLIANRSFYTDLMSYLGWSIILQDRNMIGFSDEMNGDIWFVDWQKKRLTRTDNQVHHVIIKVSAKDEVDKADLFLKKRGVYPKFGTPKDRPELAKSKDEMYYQLVFESPDQISFEIVYIGKDS